MVELERILTGKLEFEPERWQGEFLHELSTELIAAPEAPPESVSGDPDDDLILACAVQARVDALVSGDRRHLLPLGMHRGVRIITPQALLAELHD
jgi:predicted nucleic acid-binding protein